MEPKEKVDYKKIVTPIIAVIFLILQLFFGYDVDETVQSELVESVANILAISVIIYGIIKNPVKKD